MFARKHLNVAQRSGLGSVILAAGLVLMPLACSKAHQGAGASGTEANLEEMNRALDTSMMVRGKVPSNVNELTNFPPLRGKHLPTAPPGKKLAIDPGTRRVVFADQ